MQCAAGRSDVHSGNNDCSGLARSGIHLRKFGWQGLLLLRNVEMSCLFTTLGVKSSALMLLSCVAGLAC